jgi:hypothetical protein
MFHVTSQVLRPACFASDNAKSLLAQKTPAATGIYETHSSPMSYRE